MHYYIHCDCLKRSACNNDGGIYEFLFDSIVLYKVHSFSKQCTKMRFANFQSDRFITAVVNPPERKQAKLNFSCCQLRNIP